MSRCTTAEGVASWAVSERALARGHGIRTGLEDTTVLADGRRAADKAELVRAAGALIAATKGVAGPGRHGPAGP